MEKLLESFKILLHLATQIKYFHEVHETTEVNELYLNKIIFKGHYKNLQFSKSISGSLQNYSLIILCSFIDEYNEEFTSSKHPEFAERINRLKRITKPAIKRLNRWTHIEKYRNNILAHNLRIDGKSIFDNQFEPKYYNVPHTNDEFVLVARLISIISNCISREFFDLVQEIKMKETVLSKTEFKHNKIDIDKEIEEVLRTIENVRNELIN